MEFEVTGTAVDDLGTDRPVLPYTSADGQRHEVTCDAIAGCDGFHGDLPAGDPGRPADRLGTRLSLRLAGHPGRRPALHRRADLRPSPGRLRPAQPAQPARQQALPAGHPGRADRRLARRADLGRAAAPVRAARLGTQGRAGAGQEHHPDAQLRQRADAVRAAVPGRDAAHIVPPTGAKGLNLAMADVAVLADALEALLRGDPGSPTLTPATCLSRVWRRHPLLVVDDHDAAHRARSATRWTPSSSWPNCAT